LRFFQFDVILIFYSVRSFGTFLELLFDLANLLSILLDLRFAVIFFARAVRLQVKDAVLAIL
jgi:hypothetical protein